MSRFTTLSAVTMLAIYANRMTGILFLDALEDLMFSHEAPNLLAVHHDSRNPSGAPCLTTACLRSLLDDYLLKLPPSEEIESLLFRPLAHCVRPVEAAAEHKMKAYSADVDIGIFYLKLVDRLNTLCFPVMRSAH